MKKITVVGMGYVGIANAVLLAQNNQVLALDIDTNRINLIKSKTSPVKDELVSQYLASSKLNIQATTDKTDAYGDADFVVICTSTNYDTASNSIDTSTIETVINDVFEQNPDATIVIKSTVPIGYTQRLCAKMNSTNILFSPEFLREGNALHDNLYPSRIVVGGDLKTAKAFAALLVEGAKTNKVETLFTSTSEAEAIKLFSNTYLAMRVAFFNELDSFALGFDLNAKDIVAGVGLDPRIGNSYNNPSFGYGGYCLPKDSKQLLSTFEGVPQNLMEAIVQSNETRINYIADHIISQAPKTVGVYRLAMKKGSDNFRESAVQAVMLRLQTAGIEVVVFEPALEGKSIFGARTISDLSEFKSSAQVIIANRFHNDLADVSDKVFTRDLFGKD
ncbi:nucleotide sugar dehydrogenase [Maritalea porphyrae]|uniref:nucleotide sugar dehydrogenase n=1 Tax=Maritalea porphyrae TaxID=880732 RepID=UPI0022AE72E6|nr:nucleotide sugar dehydrogenase [Maritalea porphyrae]MCZ4271839.1 nucleotide sugar dehydrogenase [Maritalea porphyrae]